MDKGTGFLDLSQNTRVAASIRRADELGKRNESLPFLNPDAVFVCSGSPRAYCERPRDSVVLAVAMEYSTVTLERLDIKVTVRST
jgi:hypothetical protein